MRAIVTGGRDYRNGDVVFAVLSLVHVESGPIRRLVHGGASGADELAALFAKKSGIQAEVFPAEWGKHGRAAGPMRNQQMVDAGADLVIAFPGGRGTADCVRRAKAAGIQVRVVDEKYLAALAAGSESKP